MRVYVTGPSGERETVALSCATDIATLIKWTADKSISRPVIMTHADPSTIIKNALELQAALLNSVELHIIPGNTYFIYVYELKSNDEVSLLKAQAPTNGFISFSSNQAPGGLISATLCYTSEQSRDFAISELAEWQATGTRKQKFTLYLLLDCPESSPPSRRQITDSLEGANTSPIKYNSDGQRYCFVNFQNENLAKDAFDIVSRGLGIWKRVTVSYRGKSDDLTEVPEDETSYNIDELSDDFSNMALVTINSGYISTKGLLSRLPGCIHVSPVFCGPNKSRCVIVCFETDLELKEAVLEINSMTYGFLATLSASEVNPVN